MKRHSEYEYSIKNIKGDHSEIWVYVSDNGSGWEENVFDWACDEQYAGPIEFLKRIQENENWTIKDLGDLRYAFEEDSNQIIYQMDDLFGFVIVFNMKKYSSGIEFLKKYFL